MKLNIEQLTEFVKVEAEKLKRFSTKKERNKLNFDNLESSYRHDCIYGQMTGDCLSVRSTELIGKCTLKMYRAQNNSANLHTGAVLTEENRRGLSVFSPIEIFISYNQKGVGKNENNKILIDYLKGERESLDFV